MSDTPILLIIFNRPEPTFRVFEKIREARPAQLFIAADGPRKDKPGEAEKCQQARSISERIDWPCTVKTLFRDENAGCGRGVSGAISWFFEHVEEGIILEDDCLPDLSFFAYCKEMLRYYRDEKNVMHIGGNNSQFGRKRNAYSYYFSKYPHIWGWATWRRAWSHFRFDLTDTDMQTAEEKIFSQFHFSEKEKQYWDQIFTAMKGHALDTWDIQWTFACWLNRGVTAVPNVNLITNIGFDAEATHTKYESKLANVPTRPMNKIVHPPQIIVDDEADLWTFENYNVPREPLLRTLRSWASGILPRALKEKIKTTWK